MIEKYYLKFTIVFFIVCYLIRNAAKLGYIVEKRRKEKEERI